MSATADRPGFWSTWWSAARPATLWAAVAPVCVGTAAALYAGCFSPTVALAALLGAIWIQIGTNFTNDLQDFLKGADTEERIGPRRAVQAGWVSPLQMSVATTIAFALATLCGLYLVLQAGVVVILIGVASIAAGVAYTAGPKPLAYVGLGDVFVLVFFGPVAVVGTVWVQCRRAPELAWWLGVAAGLLSTAILVVNNLRDRETDELAGKRTLAVRFGERFTRAQYLACVVGAYAIVGVACVRLGRFEPALCLLSAPRALSAVLGVYRADGQALNPWLGATARLLLLFCPLVSDGLMIAWMRGVPA